ncbi:MAG TPA: ABC transporter substrate-binding protein [Actinopolymorphaceae bacterium]|jgi:ABC-type glycerol-3-phosphate transport system substrate-binding protein
MRNLLNDSRLSRRDFAALLAAVAAGSMTSGCASRPDEPNVVTFWTSIADPITMKAWNRIEQTFEEANPGWDVRIIPKPSVGTGDATSLITAVRGRTGPDVYLIDRFTAAQYAGMGLLEDLQPFVDDTPGLKENYLEFAWNEASFLDHLYAMPLDTDSRALYYSTDMLTEAGLDPAVLDRENGPPTIDDVIEMALQMNKTDEQGNYTQMGMIPWDGQAFWATWALMNGAKFFDEKTCELTPTEPALLRTYEQFASWAEQFGYKKVDTFNATYRPPGSPPEQGVFYTKKMGMQVDGNWALASLREYAPDLNYGITYLPVQKAGDPPFTWSGGFAMAIPKFAANPEGAWKFMLHACGEPGQRIYTEVTSHLPTYAPLLEDRELIGDQAFFAELLQYSTSRPPLPVNFQLSDALSQAQTSVLIGSATPRQALENVYNQVNGAMKQFCPFSLPESTQRKI